MEPQDPPEGMDKGGPFFLHTYKMLHDVSFILRLFLLPKCGVSSYQDRSIKSKEAFCAAAPQEGLHLLGPSGPADALWFTYALCSNAQRPAEVWARTPFVFEQDTGCCCTASPHPPPAGMISRSLNEGPLKDPPSKSDHTHRLEGLGHERAFRGVTQRTPSAPI